MWVTPGGGQLTAVTEFGFVDRSKIVLSPHDAIREPLAGAEAVHLRRDGDFGQVSPRTVDGGKSTRRAPLQQEYVAGQSKQPGLYGVGRIVSGPRAMQPEKGLLEQVIRRIRLTNEVAQIPVEWRRKSAIDLLECVQRPGLILDHQDA